MFNVVMFLYSLGFFINPSALLNSEAAIVQGVVLNENKQPLNKAHVYTIYGDEETFSNDKGVFTLRTSLALPLKLYVQYDGYSEEVIELTKAEKEITVQLTRK